MAGSYKDPGTCSCPGCGAKSTVTSSHENRGNFMLYRCGDEDPKRSKGCGAVWENTSRWAKEKTGVGNVSETGAPTLSFSFSDIDQDRWDAIFPPKEK